MLKISHQKNTKTFNNMLILSIITIAFHVYLTHLGLSPFQLIEPDKTYSDKRIIASNSHIKLPEADKIKHCMTNPPCPTEKQC